MNEFLRYVVFATTLATLQACLPVADQRLITHEMAPIIDPDCSTCEIYNYNHKVLVAVIDSGVDYLHPELKKNIHFTLSEDGKIIGLGYDFVAEDYWPSPYLGRTDTYAAQAEPTGRAESELESKAISLFLSKYPEYQHLFHPQRHYSWEFFSTIEHGTHVSGLITFDSPEIGLIPYRVFPFNLDWKEKRPKGKEAKLIKEAMMRAISDGAQIVNLSLAIEINDQIPDIPETKLELEAMREIIQNNPSVLFVAALGNESRDLSDSNTREMYPCAFSPLENLICVGALDTSNQVAGFSNRPHPDMQVIWAPGTQILSLMPSQFCPVEMKLFFEQGENPENLEKTKISVDESCSYQQVHYGYMDGTSMATPIVVRSLAKIWANNPELDAHAIVSLLKQSLLQTISFNGLVYPIISEFNPSWMHTPEVKENARSMHGF